MNQFIENYLENIIPVPFEIETSEGISRLGEGVPRFTVTIKKMPSKKECQFGNSYHKQSRNDSRSEEHTSELQSRI